MKPVQAIVFDLDDTLYPQEAFKRSGFRVVSRWVSEHVGFDPSAVRVALERIMKEKGPSYPHMFDDLAACFGMDAHLIPKMIQVFIEHEPSIDCHPGVLSMLARLRRDFRLGILTDGRLTVQQRKIRALGLEYAVDAILCSDSMGLEKPASALFEWFEKTFHLPGDRLIYVGDNPDKDFVGARSRGWGTIRVLTGEHAKRQTRPGWEADVILTSAIISVVTTGDLGQFGKLEKQPFTKHPIPLSVQDIEALIGVLDLLFSECEKNKERI